MSDSDDQLAFQTISYIRFGAHIEDAEFDMPKECADFSFRFLDVGEKQLFGPFSRKILLDGELVNVQIKMGFRVFISEEKPYMLAVYLYQWKDNLNETANTKAMHRQRPDGVYPISEAIGLAEKIHCMTNDNDYTYPEFRSIFHESPIEDIAGDPTMVLNFCLIEWDFRVEVMNLFTKTKTPEETPQIATWSKNNTLYSRFGEAPIA